MKKRKILISSLISLVFMGFTNVEALTYTTYKIGDEITVNLNDTLKEQFYVIENNNEAVKAIYKEALGEDIIFPKENSCTFEGSIVDETLKQRTVTWTNALNITLPTANDIVGEFDYTSLDELEKLVQKSNNGSAANIVHLENLTNVPFYALNNAEKTKFFTNSLIDNTESLSENCDIYVYGYSWTGFPYFWVSTHDNGSIRPIITVSKENIVGGTYISEEEILWNKFVEAYKKTDLVKDVQKIETNTVNITSTSSSLKVDFSDGTNSWTTNFTYANGIVTYVPSNSEDTAMVDGIWISNCLYALANIKGYELEKVSSLLKEDKKYTLINDGIEFEVKEVNQEYNSSETNGTIFEKTYSSFKLDIKNGLKNFSSNVEENKKQEVINDIPDTGLSNSSFIYIISLICLFIGIAIFYIQLGKRKKSN